ncbi:MAG: hypothetical protein IPK26_03730 [Planctomycetes bacterium]|nr:hypothetical protein [Planctomycetota bacterium]
MGSRFVLAIVLIVAAIAGLAILHTAGLPADHLKKHLVIDDAIYYLQPARNLLAGAGYSLDGRHITNGVQPLWAMMVTGLAWCFPDPVAAIRAMIAVSGGAWLVAGCLLFSLLRRMHPLAGLVAFLAWTMAGFEMRWTLMGMDNGTHGLVTVLLLHAAAQFAATEPTAPEWRRRTGWLGGAAAAHALCRTENALLAALLGIWVWSRARRGTTWRRGLPHTWPYVLPLVVLGCSWLAFVRLYSGEWVPIAGTVKAWMNSGAMPLPTALGNHLLQVAWIALGSVAVAIGEHVLPRLQRLPERSEVATLVALCLLPALPPLVSRLLAPRRPWPPMAPAYAALTVFVLCHLLLLSLVLADLTSYSTWYFVSEVTLVCLCLGGIVGPLRRWWQWLLAVPLLTVLGGTLMARMPSWFHAPVTRVTEPFVDLGRWIQDWLPPGSTVGAFAAGYVALEASSHTVINLDGLINDGRFAREYLMRRRIADYCRDEQIHYIVDNMPAMVWRNLLQLDANALPAGLRPLLCWPTAPGRAAAVLARSDVGPVAPAHPLGAACWRALVTGDLQTRPANQPVPPEARIVATMLQAWDAQVVHVLAPQREAAATLDAAGLARLQRRHEPFGDIVTVVAAEPVPATAGQKGLVRIYLRAGASPASNHTLSLRLAIGDTANDRPWLEQEDRVALGTVAAGTWLPGELLCHTFVFDLPAAVPTGNHELRLRIRDATDWLPAPGGEPALALPPLRIQR